MDSLERILKKNKKKRKLIITDGVFSMDGDLAKLKEITELASVYDALLMVDDSHGVGVLGKHGEGIIDELGVSGKVDVLMGSFTKAFGSIGGFIAINDVLSKYLRITARSYIFSDPIPPAFVAGLIEQTRIIKNGDALRKNVIDCSNLLRTGLKNLGFTVYGEKTSIVPLIIGNEKRAIAFSEKLLESGILAPCIRRPAVADGMERIRFSVMASHQKKDVDHLLSICEKIGKELKLI
jgi:7-keto-8-aminopelargonate synthetase-like enzyme